ncbi:hypothetical protein D3C85_15380 [compost metagenome]
MRISMTPPNKFKEADYIITAKGTMVHLSVNFIFKLFARSFPEKADENIRKYLKDNFHIQKCDIESIVVTNRFL